MCTKILGIVLKIKLAMVILTMTMSYYGVIYLRSMDH